MHDLDSLEQRRINFALYQGSFQPRQWFMEGCSQFDDELLIGGKVMYVSLPLGDGRWVVGFWTPEKVWMPDGIYATKELADARVHWLHGGNS